MKMLQGLDKRFTPFFLFYVFCFAAVAIFTSFINVYFYQMGFAISQIGMLTALGPIISMAAQPMWGILSDRTNKKYVLMIVLAGAAIMSLVVPLSAAFLWLVIMLLIYWAFATSIIPLGDAITLQFLEDKQIKYSAMRVVGALSFGLISAFAGLMLGGNIGRIFYYNAAFMVITCLLVFFMSAKRKQETEKVTEAPDTISAPDPNGRKMRPVETQSGLKAFVKLLNNKIVLCVYLTSFVFGLTMTFIHNFIGIRITELGANESQIGIALFIAAFSEIPIFLTIDRVFRKHKPEYLLMLSAFFMGLRLVIMYFAQSVLLIYIAQMVHGFSFIIHLYFCIVLLHEHSPPHMKATVQTIHAMIRMGVGAILGGLGGGFLAQHIGIESVFLTLAIFVTSTCFVLPGVLICMHKARNKKDK